MLTVILSATKMHLQRLASEQVIKCPLTGTNTEDVRVIYNSVCPLVLIKGTFHFNVSAEEQHWQKECPSHAHI